MKKKAIIGAFVGTLVILSVLYACKKTTEVDNNPTTRVSPGRTAQRSAGVVTYYSKATDGTVFKMVLSTDATGMVEIDRTVYNTNKPDTFKTKMFVGEDVQFTNRTFNPDSNKYYSDTVMVIEPVNKNYYIIPFVPTEDPVFMVTAVKYYCQCGCTDCPQLGEWGCLQNGDETSSECIGICNDCKAIAEGCPGSLRVVPDVGGHVIIDANDIKIIH